MRQHPCWELAALELQGCSGSSGVGGDEVETGSLKHPVCPLGRWWANTCAVKLFRDKIKWSMKEIKSIWKILQACQVILKWVLGQDIENQ